MNANVDLRFLLLPLLNLFLLLARSTSNETYFDLLNKAMDTDHDYDDLLLVAFLLFVIVTLFFLLTSIKVPINLSLNPPVLRFGDFSWPLALAFLASLLFRPLVFFVLYFICMCLCPWFPKLVGILKHSWLWFYHEFLQAIPAFVMTGINRSQAPARIEANSRPSTPFLLEEASDSSDGEYELT